MAQRAPRLASASRQFLMAGCAGRRDGDALCATRAQPSALATERARVDRRTVSSKRGAYMVRSTWRQRSADELDSKEAPSGRKARLHLQPAQPSRTHTLGIVHRDLNPRTCL